MRWFAAAWMLTTVLTAASVGSAQDFRHGGKVVIGAERLTGIYSETLRIVYPGETADQEVETSSLQIAALGASTGINDTPGLGPSSLPRFAFDVFVTQGLSLGGSAVYLRTTSTEQRSWIPDLGGSSTEDEQPTRTTILVAPRLGYAISLGKAIAFWPRIGATYMNCRSRGDAQVTEPGSIATRTVKRKIVFDSVDVSVEAMLAISPARGFVILVGPYADIRAAGSLEIEDDGDLLGGSSTDHDYLSFGGTAGMAVYF